MRSRCVGEVRSHAGAVLAWARWCWGPSLSRLRERIDWSVATIAGEGACMSVFTRQDKRRAQQGPSASSLRILPT
jgi:hypothetical protein